MAGSWRVGLLLRAYRGGGGGGTAVPPSCPNSTASHDPCMVVCSVLVTCHTSAPADHVAAVAVMSSKTSLLVVVLLLSPPVSWDYSLTAASSTVEETDLQVFGEPEPGLEYDFGNALFDFDVLVTGAHRRRSATICSSALRKATYAVHGSKIRSSSLVLFALSCAYIKNADHIMCCSRYDCCSMVAIIPVQQQQC